MAASPCEVPYGGLEWMAKHIVARLGTVEALEPTEVRDSGARARYTSSRSLTTSISHAVRMTIMTVGASTDVA